MRVRQNARTPSHQLQLSQRPTLAATRAGQAGIAKMWGLSAIHKTRSALVNRGITTRWVAETGVNPSWEKSMASQMYKLLEKNIQDNTELWFLLMLNTLDRNVQKSLQCRVKMAEPQASIQLAYNTLGISPSNLQLECRTLSGHSTRSCIDVLFALLTTDARLPCMLSIRLSTRAKQ